MKILPRLYYGSKIPCTACHHLIQQGTIGQIITEYEIVLPICMKNSMQGELESLYMETASSGPCRPVALWTLRRARARAAGLVVRRAVSDA